MNEFKRKQWTRIGLSLVAVILASLFLAGIVGGKPMTYRLVDARSETEKGFGGDVTVNVGLKGNTVRTLTIDTPDETEGLGKKASGEEFTSQFIEKEGPFKFGENGIEAISGATVTSKAALKALNRAITGEDVEEEPAEEPAPAEEPKQEEAAEEYAYAAEKETNFSTIRVSANAENGKITACKITSEAKMEGSDFLTDEIRTAWANAIVESGNAEADAITGATLQFSAGAVKEAVADILAQAGGAAEPAPAEEPAKEEAPAEEPVKEEAPAEEPKQEEAAEDYAYAAEKETNFSTIRVSANAENGKITACKITSEAKMEGSDFLTDEIRAAWANAIVEAGNADTDAITGATLQFSAGAVKEAVADILAQAGGAEEPAPAEEPAAEPVKEGAPAEEPKQEAAAEEYAYTAEKETNFSTIRVSANAENGKITACKITSEAKMEGSDFLTDEIRAAWANAIVEAGNAEADAITGATLQFSAGAVKEAIADILAQAGGAAEPAPAEEPVKEEAPAAAAQPAEGDLFVPGTYTAEAQGLLSKVTVGVTVDAKEIVRVLIDASGETPELGGVAAGMMSESIQKAQTPNVDTVSGATVTSNAIIEAATKALTEAGADIAALDANRRDKGGEDGPKEEKTVETDVVIVGAGGAGMTAAIMAKQAGVNFVLLEKMPYAGGNTTKATGGMNAAETHYQKEQGIEDSVDLFVSDTIKGGHDLNDPALVRVMAEKSSDAIDWLDTIGAELPKISFSGGASVSRIHAPADGSGVGEYLVQHFREKLEELGVEILYNTKATELVIGEDGRVCGVKAEGADCNYTFSCKAVILATGGFGANEEMYTQYRPDLKGTVTTNAPGATGDGIIMAQKAGADLVDIEQIQLHPTVEQTTSMLITESVRGDGAILVNQGGKRFTNELLTRDAVSAAELEQEGCYAYIIFDQNLRDHLKAVEKYVKTGITVQSDTIEGLAEQLGIDPAVLKETLDNWNSYVKNQNDPDFGRTTGMEADLTTAPYYAIKIAPGIHHTMGGVKIDTSAHVINTEGQIIPGLYAAGEVTGGVHGGNRLGGNAVADIVIFGRIAAETAISEMNAAAEEAPAEEPAKEETPAEETVKEETPAEPAAENPAPLPAAVAQGIVVSMGSDQANNIVTSYLEQDPYLVNIYEGYGFAKDYGSARGHYYTLEDVQKTQRPHPKANCITCKTGDFAKMVNTEGIEVYSRPFDEVMASMKQGINCYTCHGEGNGMDGKASVSHSYVNTALGENVSGIAPATLACGQCHIEYYFTPSDSETMMPYGSVAEMTPEAILAYYDAMDFADWTQESTGTRLLKAQHPEMETVLKGVHASMGLTCADCHMPTETTDDGISYRSHYIQSPMQNDLLLQSCVRCHGSVENVNTLVTGIQGKVTARETEVGNKLSAMKDALAAAVQKGSMSGEELDAVRKLHREAQWYFDFCYVENSEGAHNSKLSLSCLETAEGKIAEAMTLLGQE